MASKQQHNPLPPSKRASATAVATPAPQKSFSKPAETKPMAKNEVATRPEATIITQDLATMLMEDEGLGREAMGARDLAIPRLSVLQALSPVCTKGDPSYIKDAEVGEIFDNIQGKRWSGETGIIVIPVTYRSTYLEWKPRKLGGGFVGDQGSDPEILKDAEKNEFGALILPSGNELILTAEYFCVMIDPETNIPRQVVISMSKTQFKKAKMLNSMISNLMIPRPDGKGAFNPAIFYQSYKFTTIPESNEKGSWFGWCIQPYKPTLELLGGSDLYLSGRNFRKSVVAGDVKVAEPDPVGIAQDGDIDGETI